MAPKKPIDRKNSQHDTIPAVTASTFVRAACLANLLVATLVFVEFCAIALFEHNGESFLLGLSLILMLTAVIWTTAALLGVVTLTPRRLWMLKHRLTGSSRSMRSGKSRVWDDWLDGPELHRP
jgi:hypothetical protein